MRYEYALLLCVCGHVCVCVCVYIACVCVDVWGMKDQKKIWNKCEKGKDEKGERHLTMSVLNQPLAFMQG